MSTITHERTVCSRDPVSAAEKAWPRPPAAFENDLHSRYGFGSLLIEIDEELGMFTTRPPHGYSPQQLSELGTAELFVLSLLRL